VVIRSFQVLNLEAKEMAQGVAHPGFFFLDGNGVIREKFFAANDVDRFTPNNLIGRLFPELEEGTFEDLETPLVRLSITQSDRVAAPGNQITLVAEVKLAAGVHVYAPEVQGYKPIALTIEPSTEFTLEPVSYPKPRVLYLDAIREQVPVFEGQFRITQDLRVTTNRDFLRSLPVEGKSMTIAGELHYQACDERTCYPPTSEPVKWQLQVLPLDRQRSPENIQHR
jgi:DsbC/DsbD-like thiol-disulfide interchange protein